MKSILLFGIFGVLLMALVACAPRQAVNAVPPSAPVAAPVPAPAPASASEPAAAAPMPAPEPAKEAVSEETASEVKAEPGNEADWKSSIPPKPSGLAPVPTENKYNGEKGGYIASVDCGVQGDIGTISVTVRNPTDMVLRVGERPVVFGGGEEMIALIINGRHVLGAMDCKDYNLGDEIQSGGEVTCFATSKVDDRHQWIMIRHGLSPLGNPMPNTVHVYSPGKGREMVEFLC